MTVIDDHLDTDTWWQNIYSGDTLTAPLHQVIDGLDEIAAQPIPYHWLPGRALVGGAGGTTRTVEAAGVSWRLAGRPQAVEDAASVLEWVL